MRLRYMRKSKYMSSIVNEIEVDQVQLLHSPDNKTNNITYNYLKNLL